VKQRACPVFIDERRRYALRFTCEHCTYFHVAEQRCTNGYPNAMHLAGHYVSADAEIVFCKDFELI
jgi:hypothetical protein